MTEAAPRKSDLGVRVLSAVVMVAVAGTALWLGGWGWGLFVFAVACGVLWEWTKLVFAFSSKKLSRAAWLTAGLLYTAIAAGFLIELRIGTEGIFHVSQVLLIVIAIDVGAYFAGRSIGGPKIAPSISPSKTWAGLAGGMIGASSMLAIILSAWHGGLCEAVHAKEFGFDGPCSLEIAPMPALAINLALWGVFIAAVAQAGDFFESWMKRRAGVKDSGTLLPGHGGLFDRTDGLIAVLFVFGLFSLYSFVSSL